MRVRTLADRVLLPVALTGGSCPNYWDRSFEGVADDLERVTVSDAGGSGCAATGQSRGVLRALHAFSSR